MERECGRLSLVGRKTSIIKQSSGWEMRGVKSSG